MNCGSIGAMHKRKLWLVLCLADLLAGTAALAMPVTQALGQGMPEQRGAGLVQLHPLPSQAWRPETGLAASGAIAGMADNNALLMDPAKYPGAEFEAVLVRGEVLSSVGSRPSNRVEQELFGVGAKDTLISTELKNVLRDLRGELHQVTGDHFKDAQATDAEEQARLARRLDEAQLARREFAGSPERPMSEEERRLEASRLALLTEHLIDELKPWAITAAVLFVLWHAGKALMRQLAAAKLLRRELRGEIHGRAGSTSHSQALPAQPMPTQGQRVRVRQRIRTSASSSRSRP